MQHRYKGEREKKCGDYVTDGTILWQETELNSADEEEFPGVDWEKVSLGEVFPVGPKLFFGPEGDFSDEPEIIFL